VPFATLTAVKILNCQKRRKLCLSPSFCVFIQSS